MSKTKLALIALVIVAGLGAFYGAIPHTQALSFLNDSNALRHWIERLGIWGPLALVGLEALAIVASPIPSGPIALAAGAAYGPLWGAVIIVAGAEIGAVTAFLIARLVGGPLIRPWSGAERALSWLQSQSQWWLMGIVFASRLVPFLSFDAVSYAAGLTPLAFWRFALATLAGVIPISFVLTYAGEELSSANSQAITIGLVLLGLVTLGPLVGKHLWDKLRPSKG